MNNFGRSSSSNSQTTTAGVGKEVLPCVPHVILWSELTCVDSNHSSDAVIVYGDPSENSCAGPGVVAPPGFDDWD